jgi:hypothetical protein
VLDFAENKCCFRNALISSIHVDDNQSRFFISSKLFIPEINKIRNNKTQQQNVE